MAIHVLTVSTAGSVSVVSSGYTAGGVDPYFTLFSGTGAGALFVDSNFDEAFSTGGDFSLSFNLARGDYTPALGVFANMSFVENSGSGTLGDGFTGLGGPGYLGDYGYHLTMTMPDGGGNGVPEPGAAWLTLTALARLGFGRARRPGHGAG